MLPQFANPIYVCLWWCHGVSHLCGLIWASVQTHVSVMGVKTSCACRLKCTNERKLKCMSDGMHHINRHECHNIALVSTDMAIEYAASASVAVYTTLPYVIG